MVDDGGKGDPGLLFLKLKLNNGLFSFCSRRSSQHHPHAAVYILCHGVFRVFYVLPLLSV